MVFFLEKINILLYSTQIVFIPRKIKMKNISQFLQTKIVLKFVFKQNIE